MWTRQFTASLFSHSEHATRGGGVWGAGEQDIFSFPAPYGPRSRFVLSSFSLTATTIWENREAVNSLLCELDIPTCSHFLGCISPWEHLLNRGSSRLVCLLTTWLRKALNLAQITFPFSLKVDVALQWRCLSQGFIQSANASHFFSFDILESTLRISINREKVQILHCLN